MDIVPLAEYRYIFFAEKYGWTPDQVDGLPAKLAPWYMPISGVLDKERVRREQEAIEKASNGKK